MGFGALAYDPMTGLPIGAEPMEGDIPGRGPLQVLLGGSLGQAARRLTGTEHGEPRMQLWPEKLVRSAFTLPGEVASGEVPLLPPGLRREDYTDVPVPQGPTEDSTRLGRYMGWAPGGHQPNDYAYERTQDVAGMAGGGMMFGRLNPGAAASVGRDARLLGRPLLEDAATPGAPVAALERRPAVGFGGLAPAINPLDNAAQLAELANQRRAKGWNTGKMAPGHDFKRPDPEAGSFDRLHAEATAQYRAQKPEPDSPLLSADDHAFIASGKFLSDSAVPGAPIAALEKGPAAPYHALLDQPSGAQPAGGYHAQLDQPAGGAYTAPHGTETQPAAREAATAPRGNEPGGAGGGDAGLFEAQAAAARRAGARQPLEGLPQKAMKIGDEHFVPGPIDRVHQVAEQYLAGRETPSYHKPPTKYHPLDEEHSRSIARAFEEMKHEPDNPAVKHSYDALIKETADQYQAIKKSGLKIEAIPADMPDPYAKNPRLAAKDVADNNHLWFFPTEGGFGSGAAAEAAHPMLRKTGEKLGDRELLANDMFRIVHDYFGHLKEGHGFRAGGEDNAWRTHASMYSDLARPAMTTETRGQNSWVNYGPHGDRNRTASAADTVYADQKVGLMPEWTMRDRGSAEPTIAYHGSPYSFDKFDLSKLGTGEGNQAYAQGLYFAKQEPVSDWYRQQLAARRDPLLKKYGLDPEDGSIVGTYVASQGKESTIAALQSEIDKMRASGQTDMATRNMIKRREGMIEYLNDPERATGHMYEVAIDHPPEKFLDWEAPVSQQSETVRKSIEAHPQAGRLMGNAFAHGQLRSPTGQDIVSRLGGRASELSGVAGVRYKGESPINGGERSTNYVTFDAPRLLKKYALPGAVGFGAMAMPRDEQ